MSWGSESGAGAGAGGAPAPSAAPAAPSGGGYGSFVSGALQGFQDAAGQFGTQGSPYQAAGVTPAQAGQMGVSIQNPSATFNPTGQQTGALGSGVLGMGQDFGQGMLQPLAAILGKDWGSQNGTMANSLGTQAGQAILDRLMARTHGGGGGGAAPGMGYKPPDHFGSVGGIIRGVIGSGA